MENLVVSTATARRLSEAQFPIDAALAWYNAPGVYEVSDAYPAYVAPYTGGRAQLPAPTAQKIAEQLPEALNLIRHTGSWTATVDRGIGRPVVSEAGNSPAEALAYLWLKINGHGA
jgi:hypothetical protein